MDADDRAEGDRRLQAFLKKLREGNEAMPPSQDQLDTRALERAIEAKAAIEAHERNCVEWRERNNDAVDTLHKRISGVAQRLDRLPWWFLSILIPLLGVLATMLLQAWGKA